MNFEAALEKNGSVVWREKGNSDAKGILEKCETAISELMKK